jgi:hypothetical protein
MPNLDELTHDMSFTIGGETFLVHDVSPDVLMTMESDTEAETSDDAATQQNAMERVDEQILAFLNGDADSTERWKALRARKENVVPLWKILEFRRQLWETQSERPTTPPSLSVAGRGRTAPTSGAA